MYIGDIISRLNKHVIRISNNDYYTIRHVQDELEALSNECIRWSEEDFEHQARLKKGQEWEEWYDKTRFEEALHSMVNKHDANRGICWDTVNHYLEEYCRKKNDPIGKTYKDDRKGSIQIK